MRKKREDKKSYFSKYIVMVNSLDFPELTIKFSNGTSFPLKGKKGEILALDACDPEDVRKSLLAGSLKNCLISGIIQEVKDENNDISNIDCTTSIPTIKKKDLKKVTIEGSITEEERIRQEQYKNLPLEIINGDENIIKESASDKIFGQKEEDALKTESSVTSFGYKEIESEGKSRIEHVLLDIQMVKSYNDFKLLPLNLKLEYIQQAGREQILILNKIVAESSSKQLVSNAKLAIALLNEEALKEEQ